MRTRYDEPGTSLATVTATDSRGLTDTAQVEIVVGGGKANGTSSVARFRE